MESKFTALRKIASKFDREQFKALHEEMSFGEYMDRVYDNPFLVRSAFQRIYDMIMSKGSYTFERHRKTLTHYNFFDDENIPLFGLEETLDNFVKFIRGAAGHYGTEKRVLLLCGPVGSSKSTIARCLKRGLEDYTRSSEGVLYTYKWVNLPTGADGIYTHAEDLCPMREDPIKLIPPHIREKVLDELNEIVRDRTPEDKRNTQYSLRVEGELNPRCKKFMEELRVRYEGDWEQVVNNHIRVVRLVMSEADRMGIATFQPKDEKNQDATELTGDVDWGKLPHFGRDSDARAFSFDGEFCVGNRGMVEFIEMLKLAQEFLYDLLGASQEKQIKPKKFPQISVDEFLMGHTNIPEFTKLQNNQYMEALKDRTVKIDVPYLLRWQDEIKVLEQDYNKRKVRQHIAPHTIEIAALWAVLTRLEDDKDGKLDLVKKAKLYNGESLPGYTEDTVKELRDKHVNEGMFGVSARYVQDKISNCLSDNHDYINPFMVMNEIREGLDNHSLISKKDELARYHTCVDHAIKELDEILKDEVRKALTGDEKAIERLCTNYIDNVMAYIKKAKVKNPYTKRDEPPNERLMRSIEEKIDVPDQGVDDFRRMIAAFIGDLAHENKKFRWDSNPELKKALEAKLFEDTKDHIKLSALHVSGASTVSPDLQEKIDAIKKRLIDQYGYNEKSASDVLDYVGSIFARGDLSKDD
jgi:serine protein kinase